MPYNVLLETLGGHLFLKSLDITGFKSFARFTRFEFTPGITAFVGPNGSGKSNVVDAIRWCLGEQSVRDLRGSRAEDVIYAGSRHVLGVAEVSLTFASNEDESSSPAELTIARRLYRSGESDYLVDGRKARLRDLLDRLRDLGIDGSRHIVVTQGMADALLSASPVERRSLLEQAAGLSGYRVRRDEARQKLGTTEQNIATIALVLEELEPRLRTLRRQARSVQERDEAASALHNRLHDWYAMNWMALSGTVAERQAEAKRIAAERRLAENSLAELELASDASLQREREWQQRIDMLVAANHALERDRDAADRVRSDAEQKHAAAIMQREGLNARLRSQRSASQEAEQRIAEVDRSVVEAEADAARSRVDEEALELELAAARGAFEKVDAEYRQVSMDTKHQKLKRNASLDHGERLGRELEQTRRRHADLHHWLTAASGTLQANRHEIQTVVAEIEDLQKQAAQLNEQIDLLDKAVDTWRSRGSRLDAMLARIKAALTVGQRRRDAAERALRAYDEGDIGSILQSITVQRGWETAVATALGSWAHAPLAGTSEWSLHETEIPGFEVWRRSLEERIGPGRWADHLVDGLPSARVSPLLTTVLVETEAEASRVWNSLRTAPALTLGTPGVKVVSKNGASWDAVGIAVVGGDDRAASYLRLRREVTTMTERLNTLSARMKRVAAFRDEATTHRRDAEAGLTTMHTELRTRQRLLTEKETRVAGLQRQCVDLDQQSTALRSELDGLEHAERSVTTEYERWEASHADLEALTAEMQRRIDESSARVSSAQATLSDLEDRQGEARQRSAVALATLHARSQLQTAIRSERTRLQNELSTGAADLADLDRTIARLEGQRTPNAVQVERLDRLLTEHSASLSAARAARPTGNVAGEQIREARLIVSDLVRRDERAQAEGRSAAGRLDQLRDQLSEELQLEPDQLRPSGAEPPTELEIKRLRSRATQYADADPSVVGEAAELAERHVYLLEHVDDLRGAAETLRTMMDVADAEMRAQFDVAFASVREEFSRVFEVMLRGGHADLQQLDGGGIEIIAQLPGKRSRSSAAFSGGERSLIASSLLFGVLRMRPAPFCVLDEVDAALDEGNVDRYLAALRDISGKTQAIVVTHNRATMAAADVLYGLTMDTEGASKVLSLRLDAQAAG